MAPALVATALLIVTPAGAAAAGERPGTPEAPRFVKMLRLPETADPLRQPLAVHADLHTGEVFVCDRARDRIAIFDAAGLFLYQIRGGRTFSTPLDVAVDPEGFIVLLAFVGERAALLLLDFDGTFVREISLQGLPEGTLEPQPISIALSPEGDRLYVLDQANLGVWIAKRDGTIMGVIDLAAGLDEKRRRERILSRVDVYGGTVLVPLPMEGSVLLAGLGGRVAGEVGVKGTGRCQAAFPVAGALDASGRVVVLDQQRTLMTIWGVADHACTQEISGIGSLPGFLYQPADLALDGAGRIYVGQGFEGRVQIFRHDAPAAAGGAGAAREAPGEAPPTQY
jgi:DNA-binding beta-propeller fold protein YncE